MKILNGYLIDLLHIKTNHMMSVMLLKKSITTFRHVIFQNGKMLDREMYDLYKIIPERLGAKNIYNVISQLNLVTESSNDMVKHVDMPTHPTPYYSTVYYVNHSDSPTVLYNTDGSVLTCCEHERGKLIMFDGNIFHRASRPKTDIRCVVNFCWD